MKGAMQSKSTTFSVEKCKNTTENNNFCHPQELIDEYVKDMTVDFWTI